MSIANSKKVKFDGARCPFSTFLSLQGDHHCACAQKWCHFWFFFKSFQTKKFKAPRPKMTKIASRGFQLSKMFSFFSKLSPASWISPWQSFVLMSVDFLHTAMCFILPPSLLFPNMTLLPLLLPSRYSWSILFMPVEQPTINKCDYYHWTTTLLTLHNGDKKHKHWKIYTEETCIKK